MTYVDTDEPLVDYRAPAAQHVPSVFDQEQVWEPAPLPPAPRRPAAAERVDQVLVDEPTAPPHPIEVIGVGFLSRWLASNPVRVWLYGVLLAAIAILCSYGLLNEADGFLWGALAAAALGIPVTEAVRGSVYSPRGAAIATYDALVADRAER